MHEVSDNGGQPRRRKLGKRRADAEPGLAQGASPSDSHRLIEVTDRTADVHSASPAQGIGQYAQIPKAASVDDLAKHRPASRLRPLKQAVARLGARQVGPQDPAQLWALERDRLGKTGS